MHRGRGFVQQLERALVAVAAEQRSFYGGKESAERTECGIHRRGLVSAMYHAIGAGGITRLGTVFLPLRGSEQLGESFGVAILEQIAGLLPSEDVVSRHAPGCARIRTLAHQEL